MDITLPFYLILRAVHQVRLFFERWYIGSFWAYGRKVLELFQRLDRFFALRITLRNWFLPLYQDYTLLGYIFGFSFRTLRIFVALFIYGALAIASALIYILWLLIPPYLLIRVFVS